MRGKHRGEEKEIRVKRREMQKGNEKRVKKWKRNGRGHKLRQREMDEKVGKRGTKKGGEPR